MLYVARRSFIVRASCLCVRWCKVQIRTIPKDIGLLGAPGSCQNKLISWWRLKLKTIGGWQKFKPLNYRKLLTKM